MSIDKVDEEKVYNILERNGGELGWYEFAAACEKEGVKTHYSKIMSDVRQGKLSISVIDGDATILKLWR